MSRTGINPINRIADRDLAGSTGSKSFEGAFSMIFINNKYTHLYYKIISFAQARNHIKKPYDGYQTHHIIPKCMGGGDDVSNLVVLTYKEHRICHRLLIKMTIGENQYKMMYAYLLFNKSFDTSSMPSPQKYCTPQSYVKMVSTRKEKGSYKTGSQNLFASPRIVEIVRTRMRKNNPMKEEHQKERMRNNNNNPHCKPVTVDGLTFPSLGAAAKHYGVTPFKLKKQFSVVRNPAEV